MSMPEPRMLTIQDVARMAHISVRYAETLHARGELPEPVRFGRRARRWHREVIERWLRELAEQAQAASPRRRPGRPRNGDGYAPGRAR